MMRGSIRLCFLFAIATSWGCPPGDWFDSCLPDGNDQKTCDQRLTEADCASAAGCHPTFTSDLPCNSMCCASHFESCSVGTLVNCDGHRTGACSGSCVMTSSSCDGSLVQAYTDDGCCPAGCVAISQCEGITSTASTQCASGFQDTLTLSGSVRTACDPGDLTSYGPQGCPAP